jgi:DNA-binding CsgD family transcriptional regulator
MNQLTPREYRVALLAARGLSNREIGRQLVITSRTVQFDKRRIMKKLGVKNRHTLLERLRQELGALG